MKAISRAPMRRIDSSRRISSSVSPLCDSASTTSSSRIAPRSPWIASAGCRKQADVPVLESVAAILRQMMPDLPMPVTMTRPRHSKQQLHRVLERAPSRRSTRPRIAAASIRRTFRASSSASVSGAAASAWLPPAVRRVRERLRESRTSLSSSGGQQVERQRVLRVALCLRRVLVDFHEHAVDACGHAGATPSAR